jgi:ABC-type branched-subunit amino acid transport system substrate-binding protein
LRDDRNFAIAIMIKNMKILTAILTAMSKKTPPNTEPKITPRLLSRVSSSSGVTGGLRWLDDGHRWGDNRTRGILVYHAEVLDD